MRNGLDICNRSKHKQILWLKWLQCCRFSDMLQPSFHHLSLKLNRNSRRHVRTFSLLDPFSRFCTNLWFVHFWWLFVVSVSYYSPTSGKFIHHCWLFCHYYFYSQIKTCGSFSCYGKDTSLSQCEHVYISCSLGYTSSMGKEEHLD